MPRRDGVPVRARRPAQARGPLGLQRSVEVPRRVLVGLLSALGICLLLLAFAIGRESGRRAERAEAAAAAARPEPAVAPPPPAARGAPPPPPAPVATPDAEPPAAAVPPAAAPSADPAPAPAGDPAVARYFAELDAVEARVGLSGDPGELAMSLLGQAASGDTSGFDALIDSQRQAQQTLRGISPPPPCAEHHRRTLTLLGEGLGMLEEVRRGVASGDMLALTGVVERARALETQARRLEALGEELRRRYGVD